MASEFGDATILSDIATLDMERARPPIYDRDVELRLLHQDPRSGAEHYLVRYPPGLKARVHRHSSAHAIIVIEGHLRVNDRVVGPASYCFFPAGHSMFHAPAKAQACLFVIIFDGPFDVEPLGDELRSG